jgi:P4 family phage/plasmid primase-like protien
MGETIKKDSAGKSIGPGVDVQSNAFVVAPPSTHLNGKTYSWKDGGPDITKLAELPKKWVKALTKSKKKVSITSTRAPLVPEGNRNSELTSYVGKLVQTKFSPEQVLKLAHEHNAEACSPPLDDDEVSRIVQSILSYGSGTGDQGEQLLNAMLHSRYHGGSYISLSTDKQIYTYTGKKWLLADTNMIKSNILDTITEYPGTSQRSKSALMNQVFELLTPTLAKRPQIDLVKPYPPVINCANGEVWIDANGKVELRKHAPESHLRHCLDVVYDPKAKSPMFDKAVREIFAEAEKPEDMVRHWHEISGYLIQPSRKIALILILYGGGGNGKTALIDVIANLLGRDLVEYPRITSSPDKYFFGNLVGKLMAVDDDVRIGTRLPDGELKKMSEAKTLSGERKFGHSFSFVCLATPVLLCNSPMSLGDVGKGMQRRLMVIPFERHFDDSEADKELFERIQAQEMSGILNQAIAGFQRVLARNSRFERPKAVVEAGKRWLSEANPVATFIDECCDLDPKGSEKLATLYARYEAWAKAGNLKNIQTNQHFSQNVQSIVGAGKRKTNSGVKINGLRLKTLTTL